MFLVPVAFVAAELATTYPQKGAFRWIGEAFGARWGFVGMLMTATSHPLLSNSTDIWCSLGCIY